MVQDIVDSLDINEPWDLLYLAYFYNGVGLCFRGRKDHEVLLLDEIVAVRDENNKQLLRNCPHPFKNQPSNVVGKNKAKQKRKIPRTIYLQDDEHHDPKAPYNVIRKYQSLFPAGTDPNTRFYCYPFTKEQRESGKYKTASGENAVFNPARPLGKNKICTILSTLCTRIGQPTPVDGLGKFAGHGLRRFAINNLSHMSDSAITAHGGPGSRQAIMCYQDPRGCDRIKTSKAAFGASFENRKSPLAEHSTTSATQEWEPETKRFRSSALSTPACSVAPSTPAWTTPSTPFSAASSQASGPASSHMSVPRSLRERLMDLAEALGAGVITQAEFDDKRASMISAI